MSKQVVQEPNLCAAANGGGPSRLQSLRPVAAVAELGSFGESHEHRGES